MNCIVNYSDSSDDGDDRDTDYPEGNAAYQTGTKQSGSAETEDEGPTIHKRLKINLSCNKKEDQHYFDCQSTKSQINQLSLPSAIQSMFNNDDSGMRRWNDDSTQHGNRKRSFPHVEGNWATHVFIPVKQDERLLCVVRQLQCLFEPLVFEILPEFHISLSRTVVIRHHWITPLVDGLRDAFSSTKSCVGDLDDIKFYPNDDKTRTFLCIEVSKEDTAFIEYVSRVDKCFAEFKLQKYYKEASFHISVAWCLGDVNDTVPEKKLNKAKEILGSFCAANPELSVVFAQNICLRAGNKTFVIPLIV